MAEDERDLILTLIASLQARVMELEEMMAMAEPFIGEGGAHELSREYHKVLRSGVRGYAKESGD